MINYSVIIPHYNIPDLLKRCINSIPQREDVQVIVVDDNSPGSENYLTNIPELSRKGVEFYITKDGKGAGHARNIGLRHAVGKWLIFADSDDFFVNDFSSILDEHINDSHDIIFYNINSCDCYDLNKLYLSKKDRLFSEYDASKNELLFRVGSTEPWGKIIRRQLVVDNNIMFQETLGHNDLLFSVMTGIKAKSISIINRPLYWYVIREGSLGHQKGIEPMGKIQDRMVAWKSTQEYLINNGIKTKMYLPAIPFIRGLIRKPTLFMRLLVTAQKAGCNRGKMVCEVVRYFSYRRFFSDPGLAIDVQLSK